MDYTSTAGTCPPSEYNDLLTDPPTVSPGNGNGGGNGGGNGSSGAKLGVMFVAFVGSVLTLAL